VTHITNGRPSGPDAMLADSGVSWAAKGLAMYVCTGYGSASVPKLATAGDLDEEGVRALYAELHAAGFRHLVGDPMDEVPPEPPSPWEEPRRRRPKITARPMKRPPEYVGHWPLPESDPCPRDGEAVVYHLYRGDDLRYVGVTEHFPTRLKAHAHGGRQFDRWTAYICADRRSAEAFEQQCINRKRPPENRPATGRVA
jgi:hypothetical protein